MAKSKLQIKIDELTEAHKDATPTDLIKALANSILDQEAATAANDDLLKDVDVLNSKLSDYESGKVKKMPAPTVKVGKQTYEILSPQVKILGKLFTAQQVKENKETVVVDSDHIKIADFLVKRKSGILSPKTSAK